jgi:hypothetical protein
MRACSRSGRDASARLHSHPGERNLGPPAVEVPPLQASRRREDVQCTAQRDLQRARIVLRRCSHRRAILTTQRSPRCARVARPWDPAPACTASSRERRARRRCRKDGKMPSDRLNSPRPAAEARALRSLGTRLLVLATALAAAGVVALATTSSASAARLLPLGSPVKIVTPTRGLVTSHRVRVIVRTVANLRKFDAQLGSRNITAAFHNTGGGRWVGGVDDRVDGAHRRGGWRHRPDQSGLRSAPGLRVELVRGPLQVHDPFAVLVPGRGGRAVPGMGGREGVRPVLLVDLDRAVGRSGREQLHAHPDPRCGGQDGRAGAVDLFDKGPPGFWSQIAARSYWARISESSITMFAPKGGLVQSTSAEPSGILVRVSASQV